MFDFFKKTFKFNGKAITFALASVLIVGGALGYAVFSFAQSRNHSSTIPAVRLNSPDLKYTNPLLLSSSVGDKKQFLEYKPLENDINQFISQARTTDGLIDMGVYYRDLTDGSWTGVNEDDDFSPGSLQKVPLMIAYYKLEETDPSIMSKQLIDTFQADANAVQTLKPAKAIEYGESASVLDLIKLMIGYSDNNATNVLFNNIDHNSLKEVFSDLGINFNENMTRSDYISTKQYSLFFRILYNSSYLDWYNSEESLSLLAQSDFKDGLVAGVPSNIPVAHKFGESYDASEVPANGGYPPEQLHDCGIIYYPKHPYILCVMTKGNVSAQDGPAVSVESLEKDIQTISTMVYNDVASRYK